MITTHRVGVLAHSPVLRAGAIVALALGLALGLALCLAGCTSPPEASETPMPTIAATATATEVPAAGPPTATPTPNSATEPPVAPAEWTARSLWDACMAEWAVERPDLDPSRFTPFDASHVTDNSADGVQAFYVASYVIDAQVPEDQPRDCAIIGTPAASTITMNPPLD